jgi:hypothetical protein
MQPWQQLLCSCNLQGEWPRSKSAQKFKKLILRQDNLFPLTFKQMWKNSFVKFKKVRSRKIYIEYRNIICNHDNLLQINCNDGIHEWEEETTPKRKCKFV